MVRLVADGKKNLLLVGVGSSDIMRTSGIKLQLFPVALSGRLGTRIFNAAKWTKNRRSMATAAFSPSHSPHRQTVSH